MATIQQQIKAAQEAGYTVIEQAGGKFAYNAPNGNGAGTGHPDHISAWSAAAEHFKRNKKLLVADKFAIIGVSVYRNRSRAVQTVISTWKVVTIVRETPTTVACEGPQISYYDKTQNKTAILKRFASLEAAENFKLKAQTAMADHDQKVEDASAAYKAAGDTLAAVRGERDKAVRQWVIAEVGAV